MPKAITLLVPRGLGDCMVAIPAAYHLHDQGYQVNIISATTVQWIVDLPTLRPIGNERADKVLDISQSLDFCTPLRMFALVSFKFGIYPPAYPDGPWLDKPPEYADIIADLGVPDDYILVAPGSSHKHRQFTPEQIAPIAEQYPVVITHDKPLPDMPGLDLCEKTTPKQLYALAAHARAVVAVDSGPMHLAAGFKTPILCAQARAYSCSPWSFASDYKPCRWLLAAQLQRLSGERIMQELDVLLEETDASD